MRILKENILSVADLFLSEMENGNTWLAYNTASLYIKQDDVYFFKNEMEAEDFCISNLSDVDRFTGREIQPLFDSILHNLSKNIDHSEIEYYDLTRSNEVRSIRANSPDGNFLADLGRDDLTDAWIASLERRERVKLHPTELPVDVENLSQLVKKVKEIGFSEDLGVELREKMKKGYPIFSVDTIKEFYFGYVSYKLYSAKQPDNRYTIDSFRATLYNTSPLNHIEKGEINTHVLSDQMRQMNWYFDFTTNIEAWKKEYKEYNAIVDALRMLSHDEKGARVAVQLWINHTPLNHIEKPKFIESLERKLKIYPTSLFPANMTADEAYQRLTKMLNFQKSNNYSQLNNTTMNEQNLEYLKNTLKYMGFEDRVNADLERKINAGEPYFTLNDSKAFNNGNLKADSVLYFSRGKENEMYFFNKYDVAVTKADGRSENQTMYINRATIYNEEKQMDQTKLIGFTLKEAANLLDRDENGLGRAVYKQFVNKDNEPYMAWKQIDFSQQDNQGNYKYHPYHENWGYDLDKAIAKNSILEDKEDVKKSLQKGNLQAVTVEENGERVRRFVAADPASKDDLKVYNEKGIEIKKTVETVNLDYSKKAGENKGVDKDVKQEGVNVGTANAISGSQDGPSKKNSKNDGVKKGNNAKVKDEESLLHKNRESKGKGMKM